MEYSYFLVSIVIILLICVFLKNINISEYFQDVTQDLLLSADSMDQVYSLDDQKKQTLIKSKGNR